MTSIESIVKASSLIITAISVIVDPINLMINSFSFGMKRVNLARQKVI